MQAHKQPWHFFGYMVSALAACFLLQGFAFYLGKWGTGKCESNYFSTMSRFQSAAQMSAEVCVAGSSISGRLPGREAGNPNVANLGSDGGSPLDGITLLAEGVIPRPEWLVVEMNTLYNGVGYAEPNSVKGARSPWFQVGARFPLLGASARPTGMLYARLLSRDWRSEAQAFEVNGVVLRKNPEHQAIYEFTEDENHRLNEVKDKLSAMQGQGVGVLLLTMPAGELLESHRRRMETSIEILSSSLQVKHLDLEKQIPRASLHFTDSIHMGPDSAARVLATIQQECRKLKRNHP